MPSGDNDYKYEILEIDYDDLTYVQLYDISDNVFPINLQELSKLDELGERDGLGMISLMTINGQTLRIRKQDIRGYIVSSPEGRESIKRFNKWSRGLDIQREWE